MYKREIRPLSESMLDAISGTINKLEHVDLNEAKMSDTEVLNAAKSLAKNGKDAKTKAFGKGLVDFYQKNKSFTPDQVGGLQNIMKNASFQMAKESVELEEASNTLQKITAILTKMGNGTKVVKDKAGYFHIKMTDGKNMSHQGPYHTLEDVLSALQKDMKEEVELEEKYAKATDKLDDGKGMDPVGKADADIDNDGDVDSSDEYLHKRRKAIGKAMKKRKD